MMHQNFFRSAVLAALLLTAGYACAQEDVTKSGTLITPAPRQVPTNLPKMAASLPSPEARPVYIAVCPAELSAPLQPLLQWRRQQGYQVELLCPTTHKRDTIRQMLMQRYQSATPLHPAQQYVLLVGDVDRIQAFIGQHTPNGLNTSVTDLYYGEYTGDYLPEAAVGRLSVTDSTELTQVVAKIINYEQGRWADQQHQLLLAAGSESSPLALTTTNGQVNYLAQLAADFRPELDTICFYNPSSENLRPQLLAALEAGNALVNYTAHCTRAGWSNPNVNILGIDTMQQHIPTIFVNNCCLSSAFDGTCFGEQLLRTAEGGAAGVIGATNETLWNEDFYWAVGAKYPPSIHPLHDSNRPGAFDTLFANNTVGGLPADQTTLGTLLHAGCRAVSQSGSVYDAFYWETYCLLGDPATVPYMGRADTLSITLHDTLRAGITELHLTTTPGCRISAMADTLLLGCTQTDSNGEAVIQFSLPLTTDSLLLTATRHDARPLISRLPVAPVTDGQLAVTEYCFDQTLELQVKNIGNNHTCRHIVSLLQDSADRAEGCIFDSVAPACITLAPDDDTLLSFPLEHLHPGIAPLLYAHLAISDSNNHTYSILRIVTEIDDHRPQVTSIQLLDSTGCATHRLIPGQTYTITYSLSAEADSVALGGEGINWNGAACFTVTDATGIHLQLTPYKDSWNQDFDYYFTCYGAIEDFEEGLSHYPWSTNSLFPWQIDATESHSRGHALRSGSIGDNMQSDVVLGLDAATDDTLSFWLKVSSEENDFLNFYVDGKRRGWWSGNTGWKQWVWPIAAGHHQLRWSYVKNASTSERSDCAWIDDLRLPFCRWEQPYGISSGASTAAISSIAAEAGLEIHPNPANENFTITMESSNHARFLVLFDPLGRMTDKIFLDPRCNSIQYSATHLRYSIYSLVLYDENQQPIAVRKLIVTAK